MKSKKTISSKKKIIVTLVVVATLLVGYTATAHLLSLPPFNSNTQNSGDTPVEQYVNMDKTESEKRAIKNLEENPDQKTQNNQNDIPQPPVTPESGKKKVNVLLTNTGIFNGKVSASGMVTDVVEQGGTCTYKFSNASSIVTKTSPTLTNPTSTTCETVSFPSDELPQNGTWKVEIKYSSSASEGTSNSKDFVK